MARPGFDAPLAVLDAMEADSGVKLTALKVDRGMVFNELLMRFQQAGAEHRNAYVLVNNRSEGNAPMTIQALRSALGAV